ncbi:GtrA family protein [Aliiglaciecola lipolytica]|uniref:GtrA/DPMS transmembrane domain-containing protein n=1 Tax=Aliiglaciecola lipolytica E3 TaxID=1127673 RepID=K6Z0A6_9ALTE|nr:GtrA family protein [Aliiglaciecola lipolytica]GAC16885.1 hypothetical protein GLIP_4274 [Aliiglaciecola lipolytica E3]
MSVISLTKIRFILVGGGAFLVDAIVFLICCYGLSLSPFNARIIAFFIAVAVTFLGNRLITFKARRHPSFIKQYALALAAAVVTLIPNLTVFVFCLAIFPDGQVYEFMAFVSGTTVGIISNFLLSDKLVFKSCSV